MVQSAWEPCMPIKPQRFLPVSAGKGSDPFISPSVSETQDKTTGSHSLFPLKPAIWWDHELIKNVGPNATGLKTDRHLDRHLTTAAIGNWWRPFECRVLKSKLQYSDRIAGWYSKKKKKEPMWLAQGRGLNSQSCFAPFLSKQTQTALLEMPLLKPEGFLLACLISCPLDPLARQPLSPLRPPPKVTSGLASPRPRHQVPLPRLIVRLVILVIHL